MSVDAYLAGHRTCHHRTYVLTCAEFDAILRRCNNCCEICGIAAAATPRRLLCIDHDRRKGWSSVRGMLCDKCNNSLRHVDAGTRPMSEAEARYYAASWCRTPGWYGPGDPPECVPV